MCPSQTVYQKVYTSFVEALDGIDNGISAYPASAGAPLYKSRTDLSSRVAKLNPEWNEEGSAVDLNERFFKAVALTGSELAQEVRFYASSWLPARQIVLDSLAARFSVHPSGSILRLDTFTLWKNHLLDLEEEQGIAGQILYVLYAEGAAPAPGAASAVASNKWRIQCVPESEQSFESRKAMPEPWRGVRDDALSGITGIPGCVFVHASGFIGGATSYDSALKMAIASLEAPSNKKQKV